MLILNFTCHVSISVFRKSGLIKHCSSSSDLLEYNMSCPYVDRCKFYVHLRSLNVRHFVMLTATALKLWCRGHLQWHDLSTEFHKTLPTGSEVDRGDRQTEDGDLISLLFSFRNGSRPKDFNCIVVNDTQHYPCGKVMKGRGGKFPRILGLVSREI
jgi:hypothetical protein